MSFIKLSAVFSVFILGAMLAGCGGGGGSSTLVSATLTWDAPTTRTDQTPLNPAIDLQAFRLYYGPTSNKYTNSLYLANPITNPATTTVTCSVSLPKGTNFITITAIDQYGQESAPAAEIQKTL